MSLAASSRMYGRRPSKTHNISLPSDWNRRAATCNQNTWPLLLGMGVLMLGAGLQSTLLGFRATLEGFPTLVTGVVMSCYYVGYVRGTVIAPPMLRQIGHIRVFAALAAFAAIAILVQGRFVNPCAWAAMRLLSGVCFAGIYVVAESWINDRASRRTAAHCWRCTWSSCTSDSAPRSIC